MLYSEVTRQGTRVNATRNATRLGTHWAYQSLDLLVGASRRGLQENLALIFVRLGINVYNNPQII